MLTRHAGVKRKMDARLTGSGEERCPFALAVPFPVERDGNPRCLYP